MGRANKDVFYKEPPLLGNKALWQTTFEQAAEEDFQHMKNGYKVESNLKTVGDMLNQCVASPLTRLRNIASGTLQETGPLIHWFRFPGRYGHLNVGANQKVLILACGAKMKCYNLSSVPTWIGKGPWPESYKITLSRETAINIYQSVLSNR